MTSEPATAPVVVIGELLVDIVHTPDGDTAEHVGGSPANVALGLARLDHDTHFATLVGTDARGIRCREHVEAGGVALLPGSTSDVHPTSTAVATIDDRRTFTAPLEISAGPATRWFYLPGSFVHPGPAQLYLSVTLSFQSSRLEDPTSIYELPARLTTLTPPGGPPVRASARDASGVPYFLVPADLTEATLTVGGAATSLYGFRISIHTPLVLQLQLG